MLNWVEHEKSLIASGPASYTFMEIDHEIISTVIFFPSADSRRVVVNCKQKYVHEVLVDCLVKLAQEKSGLGELIVPDACHASVLKHWAAALETLSSRLDQVRLNPAFSTTETS